ncbi:MAG: ATP-binding protein [Bacteroidales bacterium]|jgi:hypothetical protein|nr:ATP-binding protein [Bacteroidales bacterium]
MKPYPLKPGRGTYPADRIVGREREITQLLRLLITQSVSVEELRRMGKTLLVKKLEYICNRNLIPEEFKQEGFKVKYLSFEGIQTLGGLIDTLIREFEKIKDWSQIDWAKTYEFIRKIIKSPKVKIAEAEFSINLPEYKRTWQEAFFKVLEDIADAQETNGSKLILIFDELPLMLWEWHKKGNAGEGIELLDILRKKRQELEEKGLRFVYCGSFGMNIILKTYKKLYGYAGPATNDMEPFSVDPFTKEDAFFLCDCFEAGGFKTSNKEQCYPLIYQLSNGLPFYISQMFNIIQIDFDKEVNEETVKSAYRIILNNPDYHNDFNQLKDRINIYYPENEAKVMLYILNFLSQKETIINQEEILSGLAIEDRIIKDQLYQMTKDHLLSRTQCESGTWQYQFKHEIFRQWWQINQA